MGLSKLSAISQLLRIAIPVLLIAPLGSASGVFPLVYKDCANQTFADSSSNTGSFQSALTSLLNSLSAQSSAAHFFKTSVVVGRTSISGLFQCRGDMSTADCSSCVSGAPRVSTSSCGDAVAARIQLAGCSIRYALAGYVEFPDTKMIYKACGSAEGSKGGDREAACDDVVAAMGGGKVFYRASRGGVEVVGQCEEDLAGADCGKCLKAAAQWAQQVCGRAGSGEVYLVGCYIIYFSQSNSGGNASSSSSGSQVGKTVAAVVGGAFALFIAVSILLFFRSLWKKQEDE